ncbi:MAG: hypothetical protein KIT17_08445 [Rubrivivax sp.]|nr:hypothetical protein [Rubrivivax sp.]
MLKLNSGVVARLVAEARAQSTRKWVPGEEADPVAIERVRREFDSSLIAPEIGSIEVEPHTADVLSIRAGRRSVWFVTRLGTQRIFVDDESGLFGVAWGPDASTGKYVDLGFRTEDPIDAFLT